MNAFFMYLLVLNSQWPKNMWNQPYHCAASGGLRVMSVIVQLGEYEGIIVKNQVYIILTSEYRSTYNFNIK